MANSITLGNGTILVNLDEHSFVRDFYFPFVGLENQVGGHFAHRIGVWVDGQFSWLHDSAWRVKMTSESEALAAKVEAVNDALSLSLNMTVLCDNDKNLFIRKVVVRNGANDAREIRLFFSQQFELYESHIAHTAYYEPESKTIIHYRNQRAFLVNAQLDGRGFNDFSTGVFNAEGKEGTHKDAEDGVLSKNPVEHGQADSVLGLAATYQGGEEKILYYWLAVGTSVEEVRELNKYMLQTGAGHLIENTRNFWHAWLNRQEFNFGDLGLEVVGMFKKSLMYIRAHVDKGGSIIASSDSNMLNQGKDTYAYMWPRDGAYAALALDTVGDFTVTNRFYDFCNKVVSKEGYFMHKYSPDGSLGSSWHSWLRDGKMELPIQEDETAIVLWSLWQHYSASKDLEFIEGLYTTLIKPAGDFLVTFRDATTKLPHASYDLWEEKFGIHTYTAAAVYGGLVAAAHFAKLLGKIKNESTYLDAANEIKTGIVERLYDTGTGLFKKSLTDNTVDMSSVFGVYYFGVLEPGDPRLANAFIKFEQALTPNKAVGGVGRYEDDNYYRADKSVKCNPWIITSLWIAEYDIARAKSNSDLASAKAWLEWAVKQAEATGVLPEQINPHTGAALSATPLVWSHSQFVLTVIKYLNKFSVK